MSTIAAEIVRFWGHNLLLLSATGAAILVAEYFSARSAPRSRQEDVVNLIFAFVNPVLVTPIMVVTTSWLVSYLWTVRIGQSQFGTGTLGYFATCVTAAFIDDLVSYFRHRLTHTRWLWPFHAVHHSSKVLSWLSNERFHPVNTILNRMVSFCVLFLLGFGADVVAAVALVRHIANLVNHSNIPLSYGLLNYLFASPGFHRWHHSEERPSCNYAVLFSGIDWVFGTFYLPSQRPSTLGVSSSDMPGHYWGLLFWPIRGKGVARVAATKILSA